MIPGIFISLVTFPGVIIHELAHKVFCHLLRVRVHEVVYFQVKDLSAPVGYVRHDPPQNFRQTVWISIGPLILNSTLTIVIGLLASGVPPESTYYLFLIWLGMSIGMHAFPSDHDMSYIGHESKRALANGGSVLFFLSFPFIALVWVANKLRFFWFDAIYALMLISIAGSFV